MNPRKVNVINTLQLLASTEQQDEYDRDVPIANVATELVNQWFDDHFRKEADWFRELFASEEWSVLIEFSDFFERRLDRLPDNYEPLRNNFYWKEIVGKANWALDMLNWRNLDARYDK